MTFKVEWTWGSNVTSGSSSARIISSCERCGAGQVAQVLSLQGARGIVNARLCIHCLAEWEAYKTAFIARGGRA